MASQPKFLFFALFFLILLSSFGHYCERSFLTVSPLKCLPPEYEEHVKFIKTNVTYDTKNQNGKIVPVLNGQPDCKTNCDEKSKIVLSWMKKAIISVLIQMNEDLDLKQNPEDIYVKFLPKITFKLINNNSSSKKTMSCYCSLKIASIHGTSAAHFIFKETVKDLAHPSFKNLDINDIANAVFEHSKFKNCLTDFSENQRRRQSTKSEICEQSILKTRQTDLSVKQGRRKTIVKKSGSKNSHQLQRRVNNNTWQQCIDIIYRNRNRNRYYGYNNGNYYRHNNANDYRRNHAGQPVDPVADIAGEIIGMAFVSVLCWVDPNLISMQILGAFIVGAGLLFWILIMHEEFRRRRRN